MSVRIASCEDNPNIRDSLASYFNRIKKEEKINLFVDFFANGEQLLSNKKADYDIYLLDIEMGANNIDGMSLAYLIRKYDRQALIMFFTSVTRCLKEGYKVNAYRYLTKPISYTEFKSEICSAIDDISYNEKKYITLGNVHKYYKIKLEDIYYIETDGRKSLVHTKRGDINCSESISSLTAKLEDRNFYRCHNSFLVNIDYIEHFDKSIASINGQEVLVSRNKMKGLKERIRKLLDNSSEYIKESQ